MKLFRLENTEIYWCRGEIDGVPFQQCTGETEQSKAEKYLERFKEKLEESKYRSTRRGGRK